MGKKREMGALRNEVEDKVASGRKGKWEEINKWEGLSKCKGGAGGGWWIIGEEEVKNEEGWELYA